MKEIKKNVLPSDTFKNHKEMRTIRINTTQTKKFCNNNIKTAKYNFFTFLPLAIIYQFNNYFNCFFLFSAIISSIPLISPLDPTSAVAPFIFVLFVSLIRELIEDCKKTKFDKLYNNSPCSIWNKSDCKFIQNKWENIQVGDIIKVEKNEIIPCDVLVIKSSDENGYCYLETTNLDGESSLKPREAMHIIKSIVNRDEDLNELIGLIEVDPPNIDIYRVEGTLGLDNREKAFFDINNVLVRGGRLKNVDYIYGIVLYTGKETKIMKNIKHGSLKLSSIDTKLNTIVIYLLLIVILLCIICTVLGAYFQSTGISDSSKGENKDYIFYNNSSTNATGNYVLEVVRIFASLFMVFNPLIPLSLMISYQVVKGFQIIIIQQDPEMAKLSEEKVKILSMGIHEDLGMIKYIFTDKTGTLTKNEMEFKACSIFTKIFDDEENFNDERNENLSRYNAIQPNNKLFGKKSIFSNKFDKNILIEALNIEIPLEIPDIEFCPFKSLKDAILENLCNIAINHNVLTEIDKNTDLKSYQGSNPDEVTLVTSAAELGIEFIDRQNKSIRVNILGNIETFDVLHKFDYTSERKRSSIIVRDMQNKIKLYMKGADNVIFDKIDKFSKDYLYFKTKEHVDLFAKKGLRTLCYSFKILSEDELFAWENNYNDLKYRAIIDKSLAPNLEQLISSLESDLTLLGITALEDKLQDNVKNDLREFIEAGINVWMITGDKLDTAESIGHSCKLFDDDTEVFKIRSGSRQETNDRINEIFQKMKNMENELEDFKKRGINIRQENNTKLKNFNRHGIKKNTHIMDNKHNENINNKKILPIHNNFTKTKSLFYKKQSSKEFIIRNYEDVNQFINEDIVSIDNNCYLEPKITISDNDIKIKNKAFNHNYLNVKQEILNTNISNDKNLNVNNLVTQLYWGKEILDDNLLENILKINQTSSCVLSNRLGFKNIRSLSNLGDNNIFMMRNQLQYNTENDKEPISSLTKRREDDNPNDISIMNLLCDKNYFGTSNDQIANPTFFKFMEKKNSILKSNSELLENVNNEGIINSGIENSKNLNNYDEKVENLEKKESKHNQVKIKHLESNLKRVKSVASLNNNDKQNEFNNYFNYYKDQIDKLDKRKKSIIQILDFSKKKKEIETTPEENQYVSENNYLINFGLIIEGDSISFCVSNENSQFWRLIKKCRSVIACRCSSLQKAEIVQYVKTISNEVTLAIGDGGNDVSMIKTANIGVGLFGKEGYQAAYNADYAISQFKYLKRLIFYHGRYSLERNSYFIYFFFFKNVIYTLPQFWLCFFSGFSGTNYYDEWYYLGFNSFITALPVFAKAVMDEDLDIEFKSNPKQEILKL